MNEREKTELYEQYYSKIMSYIHARIRSQSLAEDLCSEVFVKVYEKIDSFDGSKASLATWIYAVTRNTLTDYFRTRRVTEETPETLAEEATVEDELLRTENLEILADALESLDERERYIVLGRYYYGKSLRQLAGELDLSYAYVKLLHKQALASMKKFFQ